MNKQKNGRPSKLDEDRARLILDAISKHVPYRVAANANGISERTLYYWLKRGTEDMDSGIDTEFSKFLQSLRKIEAQRIIECLDKIKVSATGHRGCQWLLEHVFWKYFSSNAAILELSEQLEELKHDILIQKNAM